MNKPAPKSNSSCCHPGEPCSQSQEKLWGMSQRNTSGRVAKTRVMIRYNVGFNNALYIRGKGPDLSWDRGVQLRNVEADLWVWETDASFSVAEFKVLVNDRVYEEGANHTLKYGEHIEYSPRFPVAV
jgi:hypothetical protein